jgi:hypothetical protein
MEKLTFYKAHRQLDEQVKEYGAEASQFRPSIESRFKLLGEVTVDTLGGLKSIYIVAERDSKAPRIRTVKTDYL